MIQQKNYHNFLNICSDGTESLYELSPKILKPDNAISNSIWPLITQAKLKKAAICMDIKQEIQRRQLSFPFSTIQVLKTNKRTASYLYN